MSDANVRGRILWHELNTTDQKAAAAFYLKAVGWTTQAWDENPLRDVRRRWASDGRTSTRSAPTPAGGRTG